MADDPVTRLALRLTDGETINWHAEAAAQQIDVRLLDQLCWIQALASVNCQPPDRIDSESVDSVASRPGPTDSVRWGDLFLIERIGKGSFGDVYRARDTHLGRDVALKLLRGPTRPDTQSSGLIHEGHLLGRIRHPNVVTVYGADCRGGQAGLWMELIAGETLEEELRRRGPFSPRDVAEAGVILSDALAAVHGADLLHRDIKAQNVMRDATGRLVLMDFGAGHVFDEPAASSLVGTPLYVAPEMLRGCPASRQSDIYALGVLLWHLLTNDYPVNGKSLNELRIAHVVLPPLDLRGDDAVDSELVSILRKCVAPVPTERFSTAAALYDALKQWLVLSERMRSAWSTKFVTVAAVLLLSSTALIALQVLAIRDLPSDSDTLVWSDRTGGRPTGPPSHDGRLFGCSTREVPVAICDAESGTIQPVQTEETSPPARFPEVYISPNGHRVAYRGRAHHQVTVVDIGTSVSKTFSVDPSTALTVWSWTPEGDALLVELSSPWNPRLKSSVALMDSDTGLLTQLMELDGRTDGTALSFSRRYLAYARHDDDAYPLAAGRVYVADLETKEIRTISDDMTREPRWLPDDRGVLFVGRHELRLVQLVKGTFLPPKSVRTLDDHAVTLLGVAPSGAVYLRASGAPLTLHVAPLEGIANRVGPLTTIGQLGAPGGVDWSDDSRFLVFGPPVKGGEKPAIIVRELASSRDVPFTVTEKIRQDGGGFKDVTVTGDAEFVRVSPGRNEIFVTRLGYAYRVNWTTQRAQRIADLPLGTSSVEWGSDGTTLYYASDGALRAYRAEDGSLQDTLPVTFPRVATAMNLKTRPTTLRLPAYTSVNPKESLIAWTQGEGSSRQVTVSLFAGGRPVVVRLFCRGVGWFRKSLFVACGEDLQRGNGPSLNLLNTETGQMQDLKLTVGEVEQIRVRPDGKQLAVATGGREPGVQRIRLEDLLMASESHTRKLRSGVE